MSEILLDRKVTRPSRPRQALCSGVLLPLMAGSSVTVALGKRMRASRWQKGQCYLVAVSK